MKEPIKLFVRITLYGVFLCFAVCMLCCFLKVGFDLVILTIGNPFASLQAFSVLSVICGIFISIFKLAEWAFKK